MFLQWEKRWCWSRFIILHRRAALRPFHVSALSEFSLNRGGSLILPFYQPEIAMLQCPAPAQHLAEFLELPAALSWQPLAGVRRLRAQTPRQGCICLLRVGTVLPRWRSGAEWSFCDDSNYSTRAVSLSKCFTDGPKCRAGSMLPLQSTVVLGEFVASWFAPDFVFVELSNTGEGGKRSNFVVADLLCGFFGSWEGLLW